MRRHCRPSEAEVNYEADFQDRLGDVLELDEPEPRFIVQVHGDLYLQTTIISGDPLHDHNTMTANIREAKRMSPGAAAWWAGRYSGVIVDLGCKACGTVGPHACIEDTDTHDTSEEK